ncbi:hypothetical protein, partial [Paracoccus benzoatiresistens]
MLLTAVVFRQTGKLFFLMAEAKAARLRLSCKMTRYRDPILDLLAPLRRYAFALTRNRAEA